MHNKTMQKTWRWAWVGYIYSTSFHEANEIVVIAEIHLQIMCHVHLVKSMSKHIFKDHLIFRCTDELYLFKQFPT